MTTKLLFAPGLRRCALMLGSLLGTGAVAQAQTLNYSTTTATNVAGTFTDLGTTGTAIATANTDDANSAAQGIGFTFSFNGTAYTQFVLNTNGYLKLGATAPVAPFFGAGPQTVTGGPLNSTDTDLVLPFNFDLEAGSGAGAAEYRVATTGTTPTRVTTIQWKNVSPKSQLLAAGSTTTIDKQYLNMNFQVKLYEGSNAIEFVYGTAVASTNVSNAEWAVAGIKGSGAASGQNVLAQKLSSAAFSAATFITGAYTTSNAFNIRQTALPDAGRTYRFEVGTPTSTCAPVTNAVVTNTGSTATAAAASLAFTAVAGATDYSLTLAPTGSTGTPLSGTVTSSPVSLTSLTPNTSYTLTITTNCPNGGTSSTVTVVFTSAAASTATPPANDDCAGAITLTPAATCTPTNGTTVGATQSLAAIPCGGATGTADDDVWYKFVATATSHIVTVVGSAAFDAVVDVRSGTCTSSANIGCADATGPGGTETTTLTGLTVGSTYFVRVYSYDGGIADAFTICVTGGSTPAPCAAVTNAAVTTSGGTATTATATLTFTAATGATNYTLTLAATGSTTPPTPVILTGSPISLTGLTPNTSYTVTITTNCAGGGTSSTVTVVFTSGPAVAPPANDNPTGAIALTVGTTCTPTTGTNLGATTTTANGYTNPSAGGTCGVAANPKDVWYSFTTLAGQTAGTVTVTGAPAGLVRVFSAASNAGPFTQVSCAAGATNNTVAGPVSLTALTANTTYYVSVSGYGSNDTQGSFTICVTAPAPPCLAPTSLTAGSITATGATLTFTAPAAGATGYTVTYTAAGGTAQTQTATASPVTLTGLLSGKQYSVSIVTNCGAGQTSPAATTTFTTLAPAPTNAAASSVTATSASIGFTAAAGATSYTVTYTAAGGSPVTVTATTSPVVLTGLTGVTAYTVTIVANYPGGGVSSPATVTFTTPQGTSVRANLAGGELAVYPNPAHQSFTVSLPAITAVRTAQLMIVNALGQTVTSRTINLTAGGTRFAADATGLATGVYSVQVRVGNEIAVTRLVIE